VGEKKQKFFSQSKWHTHYTAMLHRINYTLWYSLGMSKVSTSSQPPAWQAPQLMASPIGAGGENEKAGREASLRDAKRLGGVSGKSRGYTGTYAKQFSSLLRGLCLWTIFTQAPTSVCMSLNKTPDKHGLGNWIQLVTTSLWRTPIMRCVECGLAVSLL
jgi:hypothetical protein